MWRGQRSGLGSGVWALFLGRYTPTFRGPGNEEPKVSEEQRQAEGQTCCVEGKRKESLILCSFFHVLRCTGQCSHFLPPVISCPRTPPPAPPVLTVFFISLAHIGVIVLEQFEVRKVGFQIPISSITDARAPPLIHTHGCVVRAGVPITT